MDGQDYHFVTEDDFLTQIRAGGFLEHAEVYGNRYGTLKSSVQEALAAGRDVLIVNDVQGALTLSAMARQDNALGKALQTLFIVVSDVSELRARLEERAADKADTIEERLAIAEAEMHQQDQFDHVIVSSTREADFERAQNIYQNANITSDHYLPHFSHSGPRRVRVGSAAGIPKLCQNRSGRKTTKREP